MFKLVMVVWVDARTDAGWIEVEKAHVAINETYGRLVDVDDKVIKIAGTMSQIDDDPADITTIPIVNVVEWYELKPKKVKAPKGAGR